ncbi:MAG: glutaredoxin domain-containing protein [Anaerolineae bacterium]
MNDQIILYGTSWCGDCHRARRFFDDYGIEYTDIDIESDPQAAAKVVAINKGNRSVPTIIFKDNSVLVEPSNQQLMDKMGIKEE